MAGIRSRRQARKNRDGSNVKLNITSMMDMFTIILVFLLKSYSTQGQLITPAEGLMLPKSEIERGAKQALSVKISQNTIAVEDEIVVGRQGFEDLLSQKEFLIPSLHNILKKHEEEARKSSEMFGKEFSGEITIQGDKDIPYNVITRVMYTCGQAGFPVMNLIAYREE